MLRGRTYGKQSLQGNRRDPVSPEGYGIRHPTHTRRRSKSHHSIRSGNPFRSGEHAVYFVAKFTFSFFFGFVSNTVAPVM